jgi:23S rRNA (adenine2503-C2)-methyltransferase
MSTWRVSLHAVDDRCAANSCRSTARYPIAEFVDACRTYRQKRRKRIMFEYTLLRDINDSDTDAESLAVLLAGVRCKINLLSVNPTADSRFRGPNMDRVLRFQEILRRCGFTVFIRQSRGGDIAAACGQLAGQGWVSDKAIRTP